MHFWALLVADPCVAVNHGELVHCELAVAELGYLVYRYMNGTYSNLDIRK